MNFKTLFVLSFLGFVYYQAYQLFQIEIAPFLSFSSIALKDVFTFLGVMIGYLLLIMLFYVIALNLLLIKHHMKSLYLKKDIIYLSIYKTYTSKKQTLRSFSSFKQHLVMRC